MISLITMGAGNPRAFLKTLESTEGVVDEIIFGDLLLFPEDRDLVHSYKDRFNLKVVPMPWNYIYHHGFSTVLNLLASEATYDWALYLNVSEIIAEGAESVRDMVKDNPDCNAFFFDHATDPHRWFRLYRKRELHWSGIIHEQLKGEYRPFHKPIFRMADLPKDNDNPTCARILDSLKEIVYFHQYLELVDDPERLGETNEGWVNFAKQDYESFKGRLQQRQKQVDAVEAGDLLAFIDAAVDDLKLENSPAIEYQSIPKTFLK